MTVYLSYKLTNRAEKNVFARTGKRPDRIGTGMYNLPYAALTEQEFMALPEDDRAIIAQCGSFLAYERSADFAALLPDRLRVVNSSYDGPKTTGDSVEYDHALSATEWVAAAKTLLAGNAAAEASIKPARLEWLRASLDDAIRKIENGYSSSLFVSLETEARKSGIDLSSYNAAVAAAAERKAEADARVAAAKAAQEAAEATMRELAEQSKAAWIDANGSEHLQRAFARGHDCQRLYVIERAALELPGYTVDFQDAAQWRDRSCPSVEALNEVDRVERLDLRPADEIEILIAWLTSPARAERPDEYGYEEFEPCEAVIVRGYLGKYDLVREF